MGKKHPRPRQWTVQLTSSYHRDRDERIARAYELIIPIVSQPPKPQQKEEPPNETLNAYRHLRTRVE
jgi:hypothetical protein